MFFTSHRVVHGETTGQYDEPEWASLLELNPDHIDEFHPGNPHFHAVHAGGTASFEIVGLRCVAGVLPPRVMQMVKRWARQHEAELMANWARARNHQPLRPIDPLR